MVEAAQIASLGQNGQRVDGSDPRNRAQQLIIRPVAQKFDCAILDGIALADQTSANIRRNMRMASESADTGSPVGTFAVS